LAFYVVIRGPLGVGKTTVAQRLAREIGAGYISIDRILEERGLWDSGALAEFLRANDFAVEQARSLLADGTSVVLDGNFYWKSQINDLVARLDRRHFVFTLRAPLSVCVERDARRSPPHGREAAREVYAKSTRFEYGVGIDATRGVGTVVGDIVARLPRD